MTEKELKNEIRLRVYCALADRDIYSKTITKIVESIFDLIKKL